MAEQTVRIPSASLHLRGVVRVPPNIPPGERRAAFLVLHGFGGNSESQNVMQPTRVLDEYGYVTRRFDMRGCGKSEGEFGRIICLEQVEDLGQRDLLGRRLGGMEATAAALAEDRKMPMIVFDVSEKDAMVRAVMGEHVGTLVHAG